VFRRSVYISLYGQPLKLQHRYGTGPQGAFTVRVLSRECSGKTVIGFSDPVKPVRRQLSTEGLYLIPDWWKQSEPNFIEGSRRLRLITSAIRLKSVFFHPPSVLRALWSDWLTSTGGELDGALMYYRGWSPRSYLVEVRWGRSGGEKEGRRFGELEAGSWRLRNFHRGKGVELLCVSVGDCMRCWSVGPVSIVVT
jgi:hypothetical protein